MDEVWVACRRAARVMAESICGGHRGGVRTHGCQSRRWRRLRQRHARRADHRCVEGRGSAQQAEELPAFQCGNEATDPHHPQSATPVLQRVGTDLAEKRASTVPSPVSGSCPPRGSRLTEAWRTGRARRPVAERARCKVATRPEAVLRAADVPGRLVHAGHRIHVEQVVHVDLQGPGVLREQCR